MLDEGCVTCNAAAAAVTASAQIVLLVQCFPSTISYLHHVKLLLGTGSSHTSQAHRSVL